MYWSPEMVIQTHQPCSKTFLIPYSAVPGQPVYKKDRYFMP